LKELICYCFGYTRADIEQDVVAHGKSTIIERIASESENRFRLSFYTSPDEVNINRLDDGCYVEINEGFIRLTGYTPDEKPFSRQALITKVQSTLAG
jgi:PAS domain-containing protein